MLRIFCDQLKDPILGMGETPLDETLEYELPKETRVVRVPREAGGGKVVKSFLGLGLPCELREVIDSCAAVCLRLPFWPCWDIFRYVRSRQIKVLASFHGDWVDYYRNREGSAGRRWLSAVYSLYVDRVLKAIACGSETLFCVGRRLHEKYGPLAKESVVFANFLHTQADIHRPPPRDLTPPYRLLYVGNLEERKGLRYLIECVKRLVQSGLDVTLRIVGSGPDQERLVALAHAEGVSPRVHFVNYVQFGSRIFEEFRSADVFLLPAVSAEGTPKVVMEAMSQAVPVVATDVGSVADLLEDGRLGLIVPPRRAECLAEAARTLICEPIVRNHFIALGLEKASRCTKEVQMRIVGDALSRLVPEIVGIPPYLKNLGECFSNRPHV
jgi:glycosyltransferase involved in cell wall biosynthesis